jgi:structural maintenance of chromosome 1
MNELCTVSNNKYNAAVSVALGKNMNAIITDTEKTAVDCIQYLKDQRLSVATFIPLDTIKPKRINEKLRRISPNTKLVLDVLSFDVILDAAFRYAVGNTLVCDTLDEAMDICFNREDIGRQKAVTLDGTVINKSGLMTGGLAGVDSTVGRRTPQKDVDGLKKQRDECLADLQAITREEAALEVRKTAVERDIGNLENRIKYTRMDLDFTKKRIQSSKDELKDIDTGLSKARSELDEINRQLADLQKQIDEIQKRIDDVYQRVFVDFNRKIGFDIRSYEAQRSRQLQENNERRSQLQLEITKIENVLEVVRGRKEKDDVDKLETAIEKDEAALRKHLDREKQHNEDLKNLSERSKELQDKVKKIKRGMEDKETEVEEAKKVLKREVYDVLKEKEKTLTNLDNMIENLRNKRADIVNRCRLEEINLPTVTAEAGPKRKKRKTESSGEYLTHSESFSVSQPSEESTTEQEEEIMLDFSGLEEDDLNLRGNEYSEKEKEFQDRIEKLNTEIDKLAPSLKQSSRKDAVEQRFKETTDKYEEAKEASKEAVKKFEAIKKKRYDAFMRAFEPIESVIDSIYKDLTKSDKYPLGGTAHLGMEEPDEPYLSGIRYNAMPPTKRYRDLVQMSGGEKTVAALALLFAIHHYRPSPFFILDEIDAALDNANVVKIGNYVRARAGQDAQFLVISLKESFFGRSDSLVGVYRDNNNKSSGVLTYDLKDHEDAPTTPQRRRGVAETPIMMKTPSTGGSRVGAALATPSTVGSRMTEEDTREEEDL